MLDEESDPALSIARAELLRLTPTGDLLDLARQMRDMGVESLLFCAPSGRIEQVVTDRQIAHLAVNPHHAVTVTAVTTAESAELEPVSGAEPVNQDAAIPRQGSPARADYGASTSRP